MDQKIISQDSIFSYLMCNLWLDSTPLQLCLRCSPGRRSLPCQVCHMVWPGRNTLETSLVIMLKDRHCMQLESCQYLLFTKSEHASRAMHRTLLNLKFSLSKPRRLVLGTFSLSLRAGVTHEKRDRVTTACETCSRGVWQFIRTIPESVLASRRNKLTRRRFVEHLERLRRWRSQRGFRNWNRVAIRQHRVKTLSQEVTDLAATSHNSVKRPWMKSVWRDGGAHHYRWASQQGGTTHSIDTCGSRDCHFARQVNREFKLSCGSAVTCKQVPRISDEN